MLFSEALTQIDGLRFITDKLDLRSGAARRVLYSGHFITDGQVLNSLLEKLNLYTSVINTPSGNKFFSRLSVTLGRIRDIEGTLNRLENNSVLDDVEFFELKSFLLAAGEISYLLSQNDGLQENLSIPTLVLNLLDPDKTGIAYFTIYDSYDPELATLRAELKTKSKDSSGFEELMARNEELEQRVRVRLSGEVRGYAQALRKLLGHITCIDIFIAKAKMGAELGMTIPHLRPEGTTILKGMYNPVIAESMSASGKDFQPVNIDLPQGVTIITGANMGGKTVVLKTIALCQTLFQFGFPIPALSAIMAPVDSAIFIGGDYQNSESGLSSFAAEVMKINMVTGRIEQGCKDLVLFDEPARTTNPEEGHAIVTGLLEFLSDKKVRSVVTTHYSNVACHGSRKLRVSGLRKPISSENINALTLNELMDYSLVEDTDDEENRQALKVATMLGLHPLILESAKKHVKDKTEKHIK